LADALSRDLRTVNSDRHLYVTFQPPAAPDGPRSSAGAGGQAPIGPMRQQPGSTPAMQEMIRRRNYYLNRAERLDGNVGYLEVRQFFGLADEARQALAGAMAFLTQTDAMIIDVRYAPGGDARMVDLLASFFFEKAMPTLATFSRARNETIQRSTLESVPGQRRPDIPVYVLTSRDTGSAAEDFAFLMQQMGRAVLVGDRTAGAGHSNAILSIGGGYSLSVSIGRTFNPRTNEGWEGTGVQPHTRVPSSEALDTAHRLALTALMEKASTPASREELTWTRATLDARRSPVPIEEKVLRAYAGQYGLRIVTFENGRLWYQRQADAEKRSLLAVNATEFAMEEGQRLQFVATGPTVQLRLLMPDGTSVDYTRAAPEDL